jgi:hypothetical protein
VPAAAAAAADLFCWCRLLLLLVPPSAAAGAAFCCCWCRLLLQLLLCLQYCWPEMLCRAGDCCTRCVCSFALCDPLVSDPGLPPLPFPCCCSDVSGLTASLVRQALPCHFRITTGDATGRASSAQLGNHI